MKLEKWALVAEIVGGVAIVLSLIFVGYEVQQNNQTQVQTATQAVLREYATSSRMLSVDPDMACIYLRGNQDYEKLNDLERFRYSSHLLSLYRTIQEMHNLMQQGAMDASEWASIHSMTRDSLRRRGTRQWLETRYHWFTEEFQAYLKDSAGPPAPDFADYNPIECLEQ